LSRSFYDLPKLLANGIFDRKVDFFLHLFVEVDCALDGFFAGVSVFFRIVIVAVFTADERQTA
jgi:hypothetical protein